MAMSSSSRSSIILTLAIIGAVAVVYVFSWFLSICYIFLRPSSLPSSRHSSGTPYLTYALITGSTDGIGRALATELSQRGFALILHGRNPTKLERVASEILKAHGHLGAPKPRLIIADADKRDGTNFEELLAPFKKFRITVLVNNVGAQGHMTDDPFHPLLEYSQTDMDRLLDLNARFMLQITKATLPILLRSSDPKLVDGDFICDKELTQIRGKMHAPRSQIISLSSLSTMGVPYVLPYVGSKGFVEKFSAGLKNELLAEGFPSSRIDVLCLRIGSVVTNYNPVEQNIFNPTAEVCARTCCERVGCGTAMTEAYFPHFLQVSFFANLAGERFLRWGIVSNMRGIVKARNELKKKS